MFSIADMAGSTKGVEMKRISLIALYYIMLAPITVLADDVLPPNLLSLIGKTFALKATEFPDWRIARSAMLEKGQQEGHEIAVEHLYRSDMSILVSELINKNDQSTTILDIRVISTRYLDSEVINGNLSFKKNGGQLFRFEAFCKINASDEKYIVGLIRPEPGQEDFTHWTTQVKRAWSIDRKTGKISNVSPEQVSCWWQSAEG